MNTDPRQASYEAYRKLWQEQNNQLTTKIKGQDWFSHPKNRLRALEKKG